MATTHTLLIHIVALLTKVSTSYQLPNDRASPPQEEPQVGLGDRFLVADPNDQDVVYIGKYAIIEHNQQVGEGDNLKFVKVVRGEYKVADGTIYRLVISASKNGGKDRNYKAVVYNRMWDYYTKLTFFGAL